MKKKKIVNLYFLVLFLSLAVSQLNAQAPPPPGTPPGKKADSTEVIKKVDSLKYPFKRNDVGSLFLSDPSKSEIIYDTDLKQYVIVEKIGDYSIRRPIYMSQEDYKEYKLKKDMLGYYKKKISATNSKKKGAADAQKDLLPTYYVNSNFFESIFGGNTIEVNPSGSVLVKMGALYQKVDNPQLSERNRSSFTFDFDQEISASIQAKVGTRLKVGAQYDTQSTFNFQNQIKLEFTPTEDDILQKVEVGNVSMPLKNSLIVGAQSLFGVKTQLKFGNTTVTGVFAEQKSQTRSVSAEGGSTIQEFEMQASDYDANRHFFLSQYFKDNYNTAMLQYPLINSTVNITKVEVWVTNRNATTVDIRNIVALADLGEADATNIGPANVIPVGGELLPSNTANNISDILTTTNPVRSISTVSDGVAPYSMQQGRDYSVLENAIKLRPDEFTIHRQLGFISLNRRLTDSDVLAVSFEYTVNGESQVYRVGEFTSDGIIAPENIVVKLLRSEIISTETPMWDLMMKNVYSLQTYRMNSDGFRLELLYRDDETGVAINTLQNAQTTGFSDKTILNLLNVDRLDQNQFETPEGDGYFDYVEGSTVNSENGYIIFPTVRPFGAALGTKLTNTEDATYIFNELYDLTQVEAKNSYQNKDKYLIKGYHKSESSNGIPLGAFNVPQGSVRVTTGGRELVEGVDFVVDYQMGRVQIVNPSLEASNAPIEVSVENNAAFNLQTKRFLGVDIEHKFSDKFVAGATFLNLNEKPITQKAVFGQEPINNTIFGLNASYGNEVPFLTKLVNKLPNIDTDAISNFSIRGDFAYLKPGSPKRIEQDGEATSYVDDFEGSQIPLEIKSIQQWHLASTPQYQDNFNFNGNATDLSYGYKRAKLSWYIIDPLFYGGSSTKPDNIDNDELSRAEVRRVRYEELFPEQELDLTQSTIVRTFDLAYFPNERGSYNFDESNVGADGKFTDPEERWGGITRALNTTNFEQSNVEYIQFWLMDPYEHYSITNEEGLPAGVDPSNILNQVGDLYFNLGNISEDVLKDGRKMYENGLPVDALDTNFEDTTWGRIPTNQSLLYAFSDSDSERKNQDVGFDGLDDEGELAKFGSGFGADPSNDNYSYYRSSEYDNTDASILTRYKKYNNTQGNSPTNNLSTESYPTSATTYPDTEDINKDQTMNSVESYYQYKVSMNKNDLVVGQNHIVDEKYVDVELEDGSEKKYRWLQFRIQIATPDETINGITGYNSIRFMRMFLTKFKMPVVLRFGELQLVRGDWRRYTKTLDEAINPSQDLSNADLQNFEVGVVNIQENEDRIPINYVLPPGIEREVLRGSTTLQQQNEQSLSLKVSDLEENEIRGIYKNVSVDLNMYKHLKLFLHAEGIQTKSQVQDGELKAIVRIGSDLDDNFYQLEKLLNISDYGVTARDEVWPTDNNLDVLLENLGKLKLLRFNDGEVSNVLYPAEGMPSPIEGLEGYDIRVKGSPNLSNIKTIMLGVKNVSATPQSAEIWFNEMRVAEFDNEGGWAAVVSADANFADFADVSVTGRMETQGFGGIEQRVNERSQEDTKSYDLVTNVNLGQLLPKKWGVELPLNYSISEAVADPKYDPQYQDVLFDEAKDINPNSKNARDYTKRRSISLINVRKQRNPESTSKQRFYSVENLSVSGAYNENFHKDYNVQKDLEQNMRASANYNHSFEAKTIEPFKNLKILDKKYLKFIKDFNVNLLPSTISVNSNIYRSYSEQLSRSLVADLPSLPTLEQRNYLFDWDYNIGYNLTKSLQFNFRASNNYVYDNFEGEEVDIFERFFSIGRPDHYHQSLNGTYKLPLDKLPLINFIKADYAYTADFDWQAASQSYVDQVGNVIQNANTHTWGADVDFNKFYKNIGLDKLFTKKSKASKVASKAGTALPAMRRSSVKKKPKTLGGKIGQTFYGLLTSIKKARFNYSENNGTYLPGYVPEIGFLGRDSYNGSLAPSLGFVFGSQVDIRQKAIENGWLLSRTEDDAYYNRTYSRTHLNKFDVNITVEPIKNLDIQFRGNKTYTKNTSQQMDVVNNSLIEDSPVSEYGNFSISYNMLGSSFKDVDANFEEFKANRAIIAQRLAQSKNQDISGYGLTSQQVMLPAFLAAYTGKEASGVKLDAFRNIPIPGWQLDYKGFMKLKWFKKRFRSFSISHSYNSLYSITNFTNNLEFDANNINNTDIAGNYFNETLFTNVNLVEEFSPLIKVDVKMKNSVSFSGRINTDRGLTLNFNNNTITQVKGTEYVVGLGYRIKDLPMSFNFGGKKTKIKGDLNLRADLSLRDNETIIRAIDEDNDQVTGGQRLLSLKFFADYALSRNLTASFYFDQSSSQYAISTTFPRQSISSGLSVRYILGN
ncbi:protein involved in gliding motility SprA [Lutibacter oricola]|uniref:Protein involved in gliding motility SprA n=1 Tax=Lutibacter oricola TaxID=762486 RepID=A0A1H2S6S3_9FLAO|nr:cell surface protein SprA [Lutibacter oricola]SDW26884.1 protein involved in gliding motility SprA [Lutibacter oricola]